MTFPETFHQLNEPQFTSFRAPSQTSGSIDGRPGSRTSSVVSAHTTLHLAPTALSARPLSVIHSVEQQIDAQEKVLCLAWGRDDCSNLLAFGTDSGVTVVRINVVDETVDMDDIESEQDIVSRVDVEEVVSFGLPAACIKIAWSLNSVSAHGVVAIRLACACADHTIRIVASEYDNSDSLFGHRDFINGLSFDPHSVDYKDEFDNVVPNERLVSAGDDLTFRVWNIGVENGRPCSVYYTKSECVSAQFHPQRNFWIMVGCSDGTISIFNMQSEDYIMQLPLGINPSSPLKSLDWCLSDYERICALVGSQYFTWKLSLGKGRISPQLVGDLKSAKGGKSIKYAPNNDMIAITLNEPKSMKISTRQMYPIYLYRSQHVTVPISALVTPVSLGTAPVDDFCWTLLPGQQYEKTVVAGCSNQAICIWVL